MRRQQGLIFAVAFGVAMAIGGDSLAAAQGQSVTLNLASQNNSGITGSATITDLPAGKMRVEIRATGAGAGPQPSHIHEGTCANLNPAPKFALTSLTNGASTTEVDGSIQQVTSAPHAIHLHKSPDELPVYVACADIQLAAQPTGRPATLPNTGDADPSELGATLIGLALIGGGLLIRRTRRT